MIPGPAEHEVLLEVRAVGLCGSDAHWFETGQIGETAMIGPLILGHEFCGVIQSGPRAGQRVAVDPAIPCGICGLCRVGSGHLCQRIRFAGHGTDHGALRTHMVWPEQNLVELPDDMPDEVGALLEPLGVALHAIDLAGLDAASPVGVVGAGPIGLLLIAALASSGIGHVEVLEPLEHRRHAATGLGARAVEFGDTAPDGPAVIFETSGTDEGLGEAMTHVRPGGRVVVVGIPTEDATVLTASVARRNELTLVWCRRMASGDLARALSVAGGMIDVIADLVTHRYALPETAEAFETLVARGGLKVMVMPGA